MANNKKSNTLKIVLSIFGGLFLLIVLAAILIPVLFKDEIHAKVKSEINNQLNAVVNYSDFDLSIIKNFPYLTIQLDGFSVVGKEEFAQDTLASVRQFQLAVNIMNVIKGEKIEIRKVILKEPRILAKVLHNGKANWDITKPDSAKADTTPPAQFAVQLSKISLENANVVYSDQTIPAFARIEGLNFNGNGDFTQDNYDMKTHTFVNNIFLSYNKENYIKKLQLEADMTLNIDNKNSKYTFKDNQFKFNDLHLAFSGFVQMVAKDIVTDIKFNTTETRFKNILSLVPGVFTKDFESIKTDGTLALEGWAKGTVNDSLLPAFAVNLKVNNGFLQYPDLPAPVQNIQVDLTAQNNTPQMENIMLDLRKFHLDFEGNPVDCRAKVVGLTNSTYDVDAKARVDLSKITRVFPIEKTDIKGLLNLTAKAKGQVSENSLPVMDAHIDFKYGYLKSADYPIALDNLTFSVIAENKTGAKSDMYIEVPNFHTEIDKEPLDLKAKVINLDDPEYKLDLKGNLDLEKLLKLYPMEGTKLMGKILADIHTEGKLSIAQSGQYDKLPTSGSFVVQNLVYSTKDLPQGVKIERAQMNFTPKAIELTEYAGSVGSSDIQLNGAIENYIGYLFGKETIKGKLNLNSRKFNADEWLADESTAPPADSKEETPLSAPEIPANVDFTFTSAIGEILYDKKQLKNCKGEIIVRNQTVNLSELSFTMLGGRFNTSGKYKAQNIKKPAYEFKFKIDSLDIQESFKTFVTVQRYTPIAKEVAGKFSTGFSINGDLTQNLDPIYESIFADGLVNLFGAKVANFPILEKISSVTKLSDFKELNIGNSKFTFKILNGRLYVEPFDVKFKDYVMNVSGSNGLDQSLDYILKLNVPAPAVTGAAMGALSQLTGKTIATPTRLNVDLAMGGTMTNPTIKPVGMGSDQGSPKDLVAAELDAKKKQLEAEAERKKKEAEDRARAEADRLKQEAEKKKREAEDRVRNEADKARQEAERKKKEAEDRARAEAEKKRQEAEQKAREEAEKKKKEAEQKLKEKLPWPR